MTTTTARLDQIFGSLEAAGYPRGFQKSLLPEWVTADVLSDDAASSEIAAILAKRLGLRPSPLFADTPQVEQLRRRDTKYKRSIPNKSRNFTAATSVAVAVAESVAAACPVPFIPFDGTASQMRAFVLETVPGNWLGLRNLLAACWGNGVPVIYLSEIGNGVAKMDGMVVQTKDRPVIILSKASELWAWQLFILAHEVAHVALGHVDPDEILIDEELGKTSYAMEDSDPDERAADTFAIELLNGRPDATYRVSEKNVSGPSLADAAFKYGKAHQIDPGHIALNFAHKSRAWPIGINAAKMLQGHNPPASHVINEIMWGRINTQMLPLDTVDFIRRATGTEQR